MFNFYVDKITAADVKKIAATLDRGGVILSPTDTIYGLGCRADNSRAIRRIFEMKKRPVLKPLIVLVSSWAMLKKYYFFNSRQESAYKKIREASPARPLSVILKHRGLLPPLLSANGPTGAVRITADKLLLKIIRKIKMPLVSTSANLHNQAQLSDPRDIIKLLKPGPALAIIGGRPKNQPSRLIDLSDAEHIRILRS